MLDLSAEEGIGEEVDHLMLDESLEGAGAEDGVVALLGEVLENFGGPRQADVSLEEAFGDAAELEERDLLHVLFLEGEEGQDLIETVDELRAEVLFDDGVERRHQFFAGQLFGGEELL